MSYTFATMFSGAELAGIGMAAAGWMHTWGVEFSEEIASVAHMNGFTGVMVADVRCVDYSKLDRPNHLHASPVCKNASVANSEGKETEQDIETAEAVCRALRQLRPDTFTLENVYGYRHFRSYHNIIRTLMELGYRFQAHRCNAANYGVPQTRQRLIVRATLKPSLPPLNATHRQRGEEQGQMGFDEYEPLLPWVGWYEAIEDLIPTLPESRFALWQLERLPQEIANYLMIPNGEGSEARRQVPPAACITANHGMDKHRAFLVDNQNASRDATCLFDTEPSFTIGAVAMRRPSSTPMAFLVSGTEMRKTGEQFITLSERPAPTVKAQTPGRAFLLNESSTLECRAAAGSAAAQVSSHRNGNQKAFLVDGKPASYDGQLSISEWEHPVPTLTASQEKHPFRAWLEHGRVVSMTPRALARFQSLPDWYVLPEKKKLACQIIGNGVCCLLMQRIAESMQ